MTSFFDHYPGAVKSAPHLLYIPIYFLLGLITGISFKLGTWFSAKPKKKNTLCIMYESLPLTSKFHVSELVCVIPAYVVSKEHAKILESAVRILSLSNTSVLIVDDCSPFPFKVPSYSNAHVIRHRINLGPAAARNTGIHWVIRTCAKSIAFTDSDCIPTIDWASQHAKKQNETPGIWAGRTIANQKDTISLFHDRTGTLSPYVLDDTVFYAPTCNLSISMKIASKLFFDTTFPSAAFEDVEYCCRAREAGYTIHTCSSAIVRHVYNNSLVGLAFQFWKYGRSYDLARRTHPYIAADIHRAVPLWSLRKE